MHDRLCLSRVTCRSHEAFMWCPLCDGVRGTQQVYMCTWHSWREVIWRCCLRAFPSLTLSPDLYYTMLRMLFLALRPPLERVLHMRVSFGFRAVIYTALYPVSECQVCWAVLAHLIYYFLYVRVCCAGGGLLGAADGGRRRAGQTHGGVCGGLGRRARLGGPRSQPGSASLSVVFIQCCGRGLGMEFIDAVGVFRRQAYRPGSGCGSVTEPPILFRGCRCCCCCCNPGGRSRLGLVYVSWRVFLAWLQVWVSVVLLEWFCSVR